MLPNLIRITALGLLAAALATAQTAAPARVVGTVASFNAASGDLEVKPDNALAVNGKLAEASVLQRVAPGEKSLKGAQAIAAGEIFVGDRVLVVFKPGTSEVARLVVMSAADIAQRDEADRADWNKRGVAGVVAAKTATDITLKMKSMGGESQTIVAVTDKTRFRRYAPDSVKFTEASRSSLADIALGDQVRARGDKTADGGKVTADDVVFGTFVTKAGTVTAVQPEAQEIHITEVGTGAPLTIKLTADSQLKAMPELPAMPAGGPSGPPPGMMAGRPPDMARMLEMMPAAKIEDLKPGSMIVVSSTKGSKPGEITAITLLANAGMLIRMATMPPAAGMGRPPGGMPLGGGMNAGGPMGGVGGLDLPGITP